jgi:hypothetical protein
VSKSEFVFSHPGSSYALLTTNGSSNVDARSSEGKSNANKFITGNVVAYVEVDVETTLAENKQQLSCNMHH